MECEPELQPPRESEALLVVLDTCAKSTSVFDELRDAAFRLARTRLISGISKDDLIGVIKSGSSKTTNNLTSADGEGYEGIEVVVPPISRSLRAVKALHDAKEGTRKSNLLNIADVCGDLLSGAASKRARKNRVVIFTDGESIIPEEGPDDHRDLTETCKLYKEHGIQVDVICHCSEHFADKLQEYEDILGDTVDLSAEEIVAKCQKFEKSFLYVVARATNGILLPFKDAFPLVDQPIAKVKRAVAKFRGVLNIAGILKIPVKRFSYVAEAKPPAAKKVSWDASCKRNKPVSVHVETQRVASAKDDSPLQEEEIVNAYPYGPDLVPEVTDVDTYAWSIHLPKGLDVIGFVPQDSVPHELLLGHVDVLIAMSDSDGAVRLMKSLVLAMQAESLGILARSVPSARGGAPFLAYVWPKIEIDGETNRLKNCFMFIVDVPMREDIRELPFAKLEETEHQVSQKANDAMNQYISSAMLDLKATNGHQDDEDDSEDDEALWPPDECNPNLDWFHHCVVHRALSGAAGVDLPSMSQWQQKMTDPSQYLGKANLASFNEAVTSLKNELPVVPVPRREKKGRKLYQALTGEFASIRDYLPAEEVDEDNDDDAEGQNNVPIPGPIQEEDDEFSGVSSDEITDVSEETPVSDFESLVKDEKFRFAAVSLIVIVRRLIRDLMDDDKAMACLQALRKGSIQQKEPRFFNDFISQMVEKCGRPDATGNRFAAFFRHVGRFDKISSTLAAIPVVKQRGGGDYVNAIEDMSQHVREIALEKRKELSVSMMTKSSQ